MSAPRNLHHGDRGDDVVELQRRLNQILLGKVPHIPETGYFGDITRHAVQVAQRLFRIEPAAGYVGPKTRAALNVQVVVISVAPTFTPAINASWPAVAEAWSSAGVDAVHAETVRARSANARRRMSVDSATSVPARRG